MFTRRTVGASSLAFSSSRTFMSSSSPENSISDSSKPAMTSSYEGPAL